MATWLEKQRDKARREKLSRELTHQTFTPPDNQIGDYLLPRLRDPLGTIAGEVEKYKAMPIGEMAAEFGSSGGKLAGLAATFAGKGAKTANLAALAKAEGLKAQGIPDEQIWKETGWTFGFPDQKPRFEISDDAANVKFGQGRIGDIVEHQNLTGAYPALGEIEASINPAYFDSKYGRNLHTDPNGVFYPPDADIGKSGRLHVSGLDEGDRSAKSITLHELQHAIQQREGFARGGSPNYQLGITADTMLPEWIGRGDVQELMANGLNREQVIKAFDGLPEQKVAGKYFDDFAKGGVFEGMDYAGVQKNIKHWKEQQNPEDLYRRLAGEAEARLTQSRMNLTPDQRLANYPVSQFDVAPDQQIVRYK